MFRFIDRYVFDSSSKVAIFVSLSTVKIAYRKSSAGLRIPTIDALRALSTSNFLNAGDVEMQTEVLLSSMGVRYVHI